MPFPSHPPWFDRPNKYLVKHTSYETPHYAVFSSHPSLPLTCKCPQHLVFKLSLLIKSTMIVPRCVILISLHDRYPYVSVEHIPSWEVYSHSIGLEISHLLWKQKVYYRVHNSPMLEPIMSQMNQVHTSTSYFFNIILILSSNYTYAFQGVSSLNIYRLKYYSHLSNPPLHATDFLILLDIINLITWLLDKTHNRLVISLISLHFTLTLSIQTLSSAP
jgi:hypothetical protein